jgi:RNA polymerase sigma-70 factor (ECF subfamily)
MLAQQVNPCHAEARLTVHHGGRDLDELTIRAFLATDYPRVVAGVALACGSRAAAEDAVQEALARAWERSERGEQYESLRAWVMKVAINLTRSAYRRSRAERRARERLAARGNLDLGAGQPSIGGSDRSIDVARALALLPRRQREATVLRYYMDLSVLEVAAALGVNEGTAKTTLFRARQALARSLAEPAPEEHEEANGLAWS